jgi:hypothetical protein
MSSKFAFVAVCETRKVTSKKAQQERSSQIKRRPNLSIVVLMRKLNVKSPFSRFKLDYFFTLPRNLFQVKIKTRFSFAAAEDTKWTILADLHRNLFQLKIRTRFSFAAVEDTKWTVIRTAIIQTRFSPHRARSSIRWIFNDLNENSISIKTLNQGLKRSSLVKDHLAPYGLNPVWIIVVLITVHFVSSTAANENRVLIFNWKRFLCRSAKIVPINLLLDDIYRK